VRVRLVALPLPLPSIPSDNVQLCGSVCESCDSRLDAPAACVWCGVAACGAQRAGGTGCGGQEEHAARMMQRADTAGQPGSAVRMHSALAAELAAGAAAAAAAAAAAPPAPPLRTRIMWRGGVLCIMPRSPRSPDAAASARH